MSTARNIQYHEAETSPYRTVQQDFELWKKTNPKKFAVIQAIFKNLNPTGKGVILT